MSVCSNCGHQNGLKTGMKREDTFSDQAQQNPSALSAEDHFDKERLYNKYKDPKTYVQPANYKLTKNFAERIIGTVKLDVHVVEEVATRPDLQKEALVLLILNLSAVTIFQLVMIFAFPDYFVVRSTFGTIADILLTNYLTGIFYIFSIALVGKHLGHVKEEVDTKLVLRGLAYGYIANTIESILSFTTAMTRSSAISFIWIMAVIYYLFVFGFVIRRTMHKSYGATVITLIVSITLLNVLQRGIIEIIDRYWGTFSFVQ
ncbi:MAG: YIP1 family protein [Candidatus Heimdallarchaeota archaeon]|nr:YIP1 family protein [Candidatus Heimdallarchaeota archaeon]